MENVLSVAPVKLVAPFHHWYVSGPVPLASTLKLTVGPTLLETLRGACMMDGPREGFRITTGRPPNGALQPAVPARQYTVALLSESNTEGPPRVGALPWK